jgi:hypothetical protein
LSTIARLRVREPILQAIAAPVQQECDVVDGSSVSAASSRA